MSLSRKRKKGLKKLRHHAEVLWSNQQNVIDEASHVAREAKHQAACIAREEIVPRARNNYEHYVLPHMGGVGRLVRMAGSIVEKTVVPMAGTALGTALSVIDVAKDTRFHGAHKRAKMLAKKNNSGPGMKTYFGIGVGAVAVVGMTYLLWKTLRADDELWVSDDDTSTPVTE